MPSASGQLEMLRSNRPAHKLARACGALGVGLLGLLAVAWIAVYLVGSTSTVSEFLHSRVEAKIRQTLGQTTDLKMGPARLSLDGASALAVQLDEFSLNQGQDGLGLEAGQLSVGVRLIPLLAGRLDLANASVSNAKIDLGKDRKNPAWLTAITGENGLVDPDLIAPAVFGVVQRFSDLAMRGGGSSLALEDVTVVSGGQEIIVRALSVAGAQTELSVEGVIAFAGTDYIISGTASSVSGKVQNFTLMAQSQGEGAGQQQTKASVSGDQKSGEGGATVRLSLLRPTNEIDFGPRGKLLADADLAVRAAQGEGKVEIERLNLQAGATQFRFTGAFAPIQAEAKPGYRFELVSNDSLIAPEQSTEASLRAAIRLAGTYQPETRKLDLAEIKLRASSGQIAGAAQLVLTPGTSPAMKLELAVQDMAVAQVKQLWPWLAAGGARRWVMANFFGGQVLSGKVIYDIDAGRLELKKPLSAQEVSGTFSVSGSRFDTAGVLPAVRDAVGDVNFAGERVEIRLASGNAYLAHGGQVALSNGTMVIPDVTVRPLIARLDMDFKGAADGIARVASMEPLNALKGVDLAPEDLSGQVEGRVSADIPLQKGVDAKTLDWRVAINYRGLAIARAIQGQKVEQADGSLTLQPDRAIIKGKGKLNGIPAEFDMVQPIRSSNVPVKRDIALVLGDKERAALAPGLGILISGPVKVRLDASSQAARSVTADLTQARLSVPWVGWSKGPGIAATATFELLANGQIRNLNLRGKSFSARGSIDMSGGFRAAKIDALALNPGDSVAVTVKREGAGFVVNVTGKALDGRAIIKQIYDQGGADSSKTAISLTADVDSLSGFNDQTMRNAKIRYSGRGSGGSASVSGLIGGSPFSMDDERGGNGRRLSISAADAGSLLRFLDVYTRMEGGNLQLSLSGEKMLRGKVEVRNFQVVNEPRLGAVVASSADGAGRSLDAATQSRINVKRVQFSRAFAQLSRTAESLAVSNAVLRGPEIGTTFEGVVFDANDRMDLRGTFMPAYGLNSMFGDIPVLGAFLGGGENGGLIGVTYRLRGNFRSPAVEVNPLSAIAPGIFRKIFEY